MVTRSEYHVAEVSRKDCEHFVINVHYAKRWPSISKSFGLFRHGVLVGVCTYGTPFSSTLRRGIAGKEMEKCVIELNRLVLLNNIKNEASLLVGRSLRMLPENMIVISFADTEQGHIGYVYQATNFIYCGLSAKRTDWKVKGKEHLHGQTISDEFRGVENRVQAIKDKYGDDFYLKQRSRKHRYLFITGGKNFRRHVLNKLLYSIENYPKKGN